MSLLERVADKFESGEYGWCQGAAVQYDHRTRAMSFCMDGAIEMELDREYGEYARHTMPRIQHYCAVTGVLDETVQHMAVPGIDEKRYRSFVWFNDHEDTSKQDVIDVLRKTAANNPEIM